MDTNDMWEDYKAYANRIIKAVEKKDYCALLDAIKAIYNRAAF